MPDSMPTVDIRNLDIVFGRNEATALRMLDEGGSRDEIQETTGAIIGAAGINLAIDEGKICVLMGLSGSGKSTVLRGINGLNRVSRGEILIQHEQGTVDLASCSSTVLRDMRTRRIAMVFQQFGLLPWRTVQENVALGLELRGVPRAERNAAVLEKLRLVQLERWAAKPVHELSGGMQQRVGLARAFATEADILLMDEPFSALDPLIRDNLQDELLDLQRTLQRTIVFVSHDLDEALKLGNHIAIMEAGRIVQYGNAEEIVLHPASPYVAEFVAHMNTINVLRGRSLMRPVESLQRDGNEIILDWSGRSRLRLDADGTPASVTLGDAPAKLMPFETGEDPAKLPAGTVATASPDLLMRLVIELRHQTCAPVIFLEGGRVVGVMGDEEIYGGLLRQSTVRASQPD